MDDDARRGAARGMAVGTAVSRLTGLARTACIIWVIGTALNADIYENANTIPNAVYILIAGGVINVVLVPQMVKNIAQSADGGEAFTSRIFTLALLVLALGTFVALALVPQLVDLLFGSRFSEPKFHHQAESARALMYLSIPQVFFYGAFVLVGQALNARQRFGPMMWAPVVNNLVAISVFVSYAIVFGRDGGRDGFTGPESLLLGLGSTAGVALQLGVLIPFARSAGIRYKPRLDFRGTGLGPVITAGAWTLGFVVVNQLVYVLTLRLATQGNLSATADDGSGSFLFGFGFLISQVPHGIITVSIVTAALPQMIGYGLDGRFVEFRSLHLSSLRQSLAFVIPLALLTVALATPAGRAVSIGAAKGSAVQIASVLAASSLVSVAFCIHFVMLRGFYALEDTRTPFIIQCVVAVVFAVCASVLASSVTHTWVAAVLLLAYGLAYLFGAAMCAGLLARRVGSLNDGGWLRFGIETVVSSTCLVAVVLVGRWILPQTSVLQAGLTVVLMGTAGLLAYVLALRVVRRSSKQR